MSRVHRSRLSVDLPGAPRLYQMAPLPGWEMIGTISDAEGEGALVRNKRTGIYCRANAGALRSLPQNKVKAAIEKHDSQ